MKSEISPDVPMRNSAPTPPYLLDVDLLANQLQSDIRRGLTSDEAQVRLTREGPNELVTQPPTPAWKHFLAQFQDPLVYLLLAAVAITLGVWFVDSSSGWPIDVFVILAIMLINALLGFFQEARSQRAAAALAKLTESTSAVIRDGLLARIPSNQLVTGDLLVLVEGDSVGADARLI